MKYAATKMKNFLKENWLKLGALIIIVVVAYYLGTLSRQQFNPALVTEKQKCQNAFEKWIDENTGSGSIATRAHFNPNLNTCLVDYSNNDNIGHSDSSKVIDIYDSNKVLLELDILLPGNIIGKVGSYLYENGKEVNVWGDAGREYRRREALLFEEPAPNY